jgi:hypothetical protein
MTRPILRKAERSAIGALRSSPERTKISMLSPMSRQLTRMTSTNSSIANAGSATTLRGTLSIAAMAKMKTAMTLRPSSGSF